MRRHLRAVALGIGAGPGTASLLREAVVWPGHRRETDLLVCTLASSGVQAAPSSYLFLGKRPSKCSLVSPAHIRYEARLPGGRRGRAASLRDPLPKDPVEAPEGRNAPRPARSGEGQPQHALLLAPETHFRGFRLKIIKLIGENHLIK